MPYITAGRELTGDDPNSLILIFLDPLHPLSLILSSSPTTFSPQ